MPGIVTILYVKVNYYGVRMANATLELTFSLFYILTINNRL